MLYNMVICILRDEVFSSALTLKICDSYYFQHDSDPKRTANSTRLEYISIKKNSENHSTVAFSHSYSEFMARF